MGREKQTSHMSSGQRAKGAHKHPFLIVLAIIILIANIGALIWSVLPINKEVLVGKSAHNAITITNLMSPDIPICDIAFASPSRLILYNNYYLICMINQKGNWTVDSMINLKKIKMNYFQGSVHTEIFCTSDGNKVIMRNNLTDSSPSYLLELGFPSTKTYVYDAETHILKITYMGEKEIAKQFSGGVSDLATSNPNAHYLDGLSKDPQYSFLANGDYYQLDDHRFIFIATINGADSKSMGDFRIFTYDAITHSVSIQKIS